MPSAPDSTPLPWPPHTHQVVPWRQTTRGGTVEDRKLDKITVTLPPRIANRDVHLPPVLAAQLTTATLAIDALDSGHGEHLGALGTLLLRTESVASSKIERVEADVADYARAMYGNRSNASAVSMAAATEALAALIHSVNGGTDITLDAILDSHRVLMADDQYEQAHAGKIRDMQNWIGGSDYSPRNADYVPPPPDTVSGYLEDLLAFANRTNIAPIAQAAIAHAQFESIHPHTDGNGRIGRALVNTILRRRGVTHRIVVPLASALVARRDEYFAVLDDYRAGNPEPIISSFATASAIAAHESLTTARRVAEFPEQWRDAAGHPRNGSAPAKLLAKLTEHPVFSADEAETLIGGPTSSVYSAVTRLAGAGILRPLTDRKRNQVWGVADMLDELNDLGTRIAATAKNSL